MEVKLQRWAATISGWAATKREIGEVWVFGSRARADNRPESDLDVAIVISGPERPKGDRFGDWVALADQWEKELQNLVSVRIDLDIGDADIAENVVAPALRREGIRIFPSPKV